MTNFIKVNEKREVKGYDVTILWLVWLTKMPNSSDGYRLTLLQCDRTTGEINDKFTVKIGTLKQCREYYKEHYTD